MVLCVHCSETALIPIYGADDIQKSYPFCCHGCQTVYQVLHQKGLESYYVIKQQASKFKRRSPVEIKESNFKFLDDDEFLKEYSYSLNSDERVMEIYLEGIHCLACLWLVEKLPDFVPNVLSSRLDIDRSVVKVVINRNGKFSSACSELNSLGYRPHPLKRNQETVALKSKEERTALIRIGIAGAAAGNIMIYAVSLYGGASGEYAWLFNLLTVLFAVPVLSFCAYPFYHNAVSALRNKTLSIDIPISIALIVGAIMGLYNLAIGLTENYFDSLTTLVFLLLLSRYFLQKIQEKGFSAQDLHFFYQSESVLKRINNRFEEIHPKFIRKGDVIKVREGEFFPADGLVIEGSSHVNNSLLTGESYPQKIKPGAEIYSGTQNLDSELLIEVKCNPEESKLGKLLKSVESGWSHKSKLIDITGRVSKYFTLIVFILSAVLFVSLLPNHSMKHALEQAITLLIVTCPCALALAIPLTLTKSLSQASKNGIIIKSDEVFEKISKIKTIYLDKTGTLTFGKMSVSDFNHLSPSSVNIPSVIYNLEKKSHHPVSLALKDYIQDKEWENIQVEDYLEVPGQGVQGKIDGYFYEIKKGKIYQDHVVIAEFSLQDVLRPDSKRIVSCLKDSGKELKILSGDKQEVVNQVCQDLNLDRQSSLGDLSPEDKSQIIAHSSESLMLGDGANDAIALGRANVGVAAHGSMEISLRAADVYLSIPGLDAVEKLFILSEETMKVVRRNFILSLTYNSISVVATFMGVINPLVAAIIMPVSSLTVLISTLIGTKKMRELWKS